MSKTKFTPGPWKIVKEGHEGEIISIRDKHRNWIGECNYALVGDESMYGHPIITEREALANARLIAAAPEMYEALEKIMEIELAIAQEYPVYADDSTIYAIAENAIRKARGESEESK